MLERKGQRLTDLSFLMKDSEILSRDDAQKLTYLGKTLRGWGGLLCVLVLQCYPAREDTTVFLLGKTEQYSVH
jgi:hypothetical protein